MISDAARILMQYAFWAGFGGGAALGLFVALLVAIRPAKWPRFGRDIINVSPPNEGLKLTKDTHHRGVL